MPGENAGEEEQTRFRNTMVQTRIIAAPIAGKESLPGREKTTASAGIMRAAPQASGNISLPEAKTKGTINRVQGKRELEVEEGRKHLQPGKNQISAETAKKADR